MSFDLLEEHTLNKEEKYSFLRHNETGLEIAYHKHKTTEDNFSFTFKTPVTKPFLGTSHAVEHCVFGGSRKYPFDMMYLLKYLVFSEFNGSTSYLSTSFSFKTNITLNFKKMLPIIADSVFFPLLTEYTFMHEVFRIERDDDGPFPSGSLYNEMSCDKNGTEHGGSPYKVHELTLQKVRNYHKKYYRPDNCLFSYDGPLALENLLKLIESTFLPDLCSSFKTTEKSKTRLIENCTAEATTKKPYYNQCYLGKSPDTNADKLSWYWAFGFSPLVPFCCKEECRTAINIECFHTKYDRREKKSPEFKSNEEIIEEFFLKHDRRKYNRKLYDYHEWANKNQNEEVAKYAGPFTDYDDKIIKWDVVDEEVKDRKTGIVSFYKRESASLMILLSKDKKEHYSDFALCFWLRSYFHEKIRRAGYAYGVNLVVYPESIAFSILNAPDEEKALSYLFELIKELEHFTQDDMIITHIAAFNYLCGNLYHPRVYSKTYDLVEFSPEFFSVTPQDMEDSLKRVKSII